MSCSSSLDGFFFKKDLQKWSYRHELVDDENEFIYREEWCSNGGEEIGYPARSGWQTLKSLRMIHLHMCEASKNCSITLLETHHYIFFFLRLRFSPSRRLFSRKMTHGVEQPNIFFYADVCLAWQGSRPVRHGWWV
ncbi:hypothetical protein Q3G72_027841 [Acer saccharum]|nr:hypothetical protein Q3G72_027841 [Acer saccharum]